MYAKFYGLDQAPFHITPDADFLFLTPSHKQALGSIIYGLEERKGFIAITGEVGLGKTTILRTLLSRIDTEKNKIIYLLNPCLSFNELLQFLIQEMGQQPIGIESSDLISQLNGLLISEYQNGKTVVLLIDEAHLMPVETIKNLRLISNLETSKDKLLQIVLVGQPELEVILKQDDLRALQQRIAVRAILSPLSPKEGLTYIKHRLDKAGAKGKKIFTKRALSLLVQEGKGVPRRLNILCDNALVTGYGYLKAPVNPRIVKEVIGDFGGITPRSFWAREWLVASGIAVAIVLAFGVKSLSPFGSYEVSVVKDMLGESFFATSSRPPGLVVQKMGEVKTSIVTLDDPRMLGNEVVTEQSNSLKVSLNDNSFNVQDENIEGRQGPNVFETKMVRDGDTLHKLIRQVYGMSNPQKIQLIVENNPSLEHEMKIYPGQILKFPRQEKRVTDKRDGVVDEEQVFVSGQEKFILAENQKP